MDATTAQSNSPSQFLRDLVRELRPQQWYKQLIIFIPIVFSLQAGSSGAWIRAALGAALFSTTAGSIYIVNDILDREEDRNHPVKQHRPIASGRLSVWTALVAAVAIAGTSFLFAAAVDIRFLAVLFVYVVQNLAYSFGLKRVVFVDLFSISAGFVLRAIAGVVLINAPLSPWLFLSTFLAALLLGSGKRRGELANDDVDSTTRTNLETYSPELLNFVFFSSAGTLLVSYSLYTFFAQRIEMMATIPFAFYAVFRYAYRILVEEIETPRRALFDPVLLANFILWGMLIIVILYVLPEAVRV